MEEPPHLGMFGAAQRHDTYKATSSAWLLAHSAQASEMMMIYDKNDGLLLAHIIIGSY